MAEPAHHRESAGTYRRRRLAAAAGAALLIVLVLVLVVRFGTDLEEGATAAGAPVTTTSTTTSTTAGQPSSTDAATTTTALVIPGFATPQAYLACVKDRESRGNYQAVSPSGLFFGAYQIDQVTWNNTAQHAGLTNLYDIQPNLASPSDQDTLAMALLEWQGTSPWAGDC